MPMWSKSVGFAPRAKAITSPGWISAGATGVPIVACSSEECGSTLWPPDAWATVKRTRPEQSKPIVFAPCAIPTVGPDAFPPPHEYGRPSSPEAAATTICPNEEVGELELRDAV